MAKEYIDREKFKHLFECELDDLGYESPIKIYEDLEFNFENKIEEDILQAVLRVGIDVDKEELYKALKYDRKQYEKGYEDAMKALSRADAVEVVRCKDCNNSIFIKSCSKYECKKGCGALKYSNDYCSYGVRKE